MSGFDITGGITRFAARVFERFFDIGVDAVSGTREVTYVDMNTGHSRQAYVNENPLWHSYYNGRRALAVDVGAVKAGLTDGARYVDEKLGVRDNPVMAIVNAPLRPIVAAAYVIGGGMVHEVGGVGAGVERMAKASDALEFAEGLKQTVVSGGSMASIVATPAMMPVMPGGSATAVVVNGARQATAGGAPFFTMDASALLSTSGVMLMAAQEDDDGTATAPAKWEGPHSQSEQNSPRLRAVKERGPERRQTPRRDIGSPTRVVRDVINDGTDRHTIDRWVSGKRGIKAGPNGHILKWEVSPNGAPKARTLTDIDTRALSSHDVQSAIRSYFSRRGIDPEMIIMKNARVEGNGLVVEVEVSTYQRSTGTFNSDAPLHIRSERLVITHEPPMAVPNGGNMPIVGGDFKIKVIIEP